MKSNGLRMAIVVSSIIAASVSSSRISQAQIVNGPQGRGQMRQAPKNYISDLKLLGEDLGKKYSVRLLIDPSIFVPTTPKNPSDVTTIDKAMDALTKSIKGTTWKRVYLRQGSQGVLPSADKLATSVRAMDQIEQIGLITEAPGSVKASVLAKDYAIAETFKDEMVQNNFNPAPVYVLYATNATSGGFSEDRFADLQRQQMEMMMNMTPEQMSQAMQSSMNVFSNMDPATRQQFMGNMMRAGMQMFQNMSPDQRNSLFQGFGPPPPPGRPRP